MFFFFFVLGGGFGFRNSSLMTQGFGMRGLEVLFSQGLKLRVLGLGFRVSVVFVLGVRALSWGLLV